MYTIEGISHIVGTWHERQNVSNYRTLLNSLVWSSTKKTPLLVHCEWIPPVSFHGMTSSIIPQANFHVMRSSFVPLSCTISCERRAIFAITALRSPWRDEPLELMPLVILVTGQPMNRLIVSDASLLGSVTRGRDAIPQTVLWWHIVWYGIKELRSLSDKMTI